MIVVYSQLKKLLPDLVAKGQDLADTFALIGHFCSSYQKDGLEEIYDLEVRAANRPDCLGYLGLARDLAAFYQILVAKPKPVTKKIEGSSDARKINIQITAKDYVKALSACLITNLQISNSPDWLVKLLSYHSINSVNNLVDLTNYIMLLYGIPCHAFDADSVDYSLNWTTSKKGDTMTTFDGTKLVLPVGTLVIEDKNSIASLSSIGGQKTGINESSSNTILEMAIYDPTKVHTDSQVLNIQTEARLRLEKILSPAEIPEAFLHLQSLVLEYCHGEITEQFLNFQNFIPNNLQIKFDPESPTKYAGTNIPASTSIRILESLGCQVSLDFFITPPSWRTDINCQEDLIEEVIRIYGYNQIPTSEPIDPKPLPDITPIGLNLAVSTANILVSLGYDEIRSWTLIQEKYLLKDDPNTPVRTENNINDEYPFLRQSLISSLIKQADIYCRYLLPKPKFFEIGKIFSKTDSDYLENLAVAIFCQNEDELNQTVNTITEVLELDTSKIARTTYCNKDGYYTQLVLDGVRSFKNFNTQPKNTNAIELTTQVQSFDATISFDTEQKPEDLISLYSKKVSSTILWSMLVKDYYHDPKQKKHSYTLTAYYYNCTSQDAKSTHLRAFNLKS